MHGAANAIDWIRLYANGTIDRTCSAPYHSGFLAGKTDKLYLKYNSIDKDRICCVRAIGKWFVHGEQENRVLRTSTSSNPMVPSMNHHRPSGKIVPFPQFQESCQQAFALNHLAPPIATAGLVHQQIVPR